MPIMRMHYVSDHLMSSSPTTLAGQSIINGPFSGISVPNPNTSTVLVKKDLTSEEKMARDIIRRRELEAQRRIRIFDPKVRQIGLDLETLNAQVQEKKHIQEEEAARDNLYAEQTAFYNNVMKKEDLNAARARREAEENIRSFSLNNCRKDQSATWDLNDPNALKKMTLDQLGPATAASMRNFSGEDEAARERLAAQKRQQRDWIQQHLLEKDLRKKAEDEQIRQWADQTQQVNLMKTAVEQKMSEARKEAEVRQANLNKHLFTERTQRELEHRLKTEAENAAEINFNLTDPMLADGRLHLTGHIPIDGNDASCLGGDKYSMAPLRPNYKGMTQSERQKYLDDNLELWREKYQRAQKEKDEQHEWDQQLELQRKTLVACERERQKYSRRVAEEQVNTNLSLAKEQQNRQDFVNKVLYTNQPQDYFFECFGSSTR